MMSEWWAQIRAVIRLEMKKTFFARRGLWVYLLALAPVLLFLGHSIDEMRNRDARSELAAAHPVASEGLNSIKSGMTPAEVEAKVGEPYSQSRFHRRGHDRVTYRYTDGETDYVFTFFDDELQGISQRTRAGLTQDSLIFATVFQFFFLRLAIFFGCVGVFMNLFRGEMIDKSLHFYLLAPIRREVLVAGKYLAGLIATVVIFTTSTALQLWAASLYLDKRVLDDYLHGPGWGHAAAYLGVTVLACLGYGSVFLAAGLLFRNPMIPAVSVLLWESANVFLPAVLKKISVIFYLQSMCPVIASPGSEGYGIFSVLMSSAEPTPAVFAIAGLVAVTAVVLVLASLRARKLEINYGTD
jgi:ABC-type transport system involved in multi-copper enzyme maturation permease subunit